MANDAQEKIRDFIVENFLFGDDVQPLPGDLSLMENDLVDSTGVLELVGFIEEAFEVKVGDADIVPGNLDSIDRIAAFIERKKAA
ncbi:acyl carrier protein (plasmid) [Mesorhizobium sp. NBSH29]|uniref:acyl carrier protein n=1 Tax=Mesorhizobium sp. NBSH29 TaxID=2654249 RepID=UPI0018966F9C|nr:acyl carrier protein [Mesorhizobium sp. NBSH29]QPC88875.1 acyl carrier protein [Mesorhizobium sp. NBSH29]QPC89084.1 acyl carrier protein [Mesorhizobium sp. NBSH29]